MLAADTDKFEQLRKTFLYTSSTAPEWLSVGWGTSPSSASTTDPQSSRDVQVIESVTSYIGKSERDLFNSNSSRESQCSSLMRGFVGGSQVHAVVGNISRVESSLFNQSANVVMGCGVVEISAAHLNRSAWPQKTDIVITSGEYCTVVEVKTPLVPAYNGNCVVGTFTSITGSPLDFSPLPIDLNQSFRGGEELAVAVRKSEKRKRRMAAHHSALALLRRAEAARAKATEDEARQGIDWDSWDEEGVT